MSRKDRRAVRAIMRKSSDLRDLERRKRLTKLAHALSIPYSVDQAHQEWARWYRRGLADGKNQAAGAIFSLLNEEVLND